jgi:hypothetical protein
MERAGAATAAVAAVPEDVRDLAAQLAVNERDARAVAAGLSDAAGEWRAAPGTWSVAQCLDHLATANRVYLAAMRPAAERARHERRMRRRPIAPTFFGGLFVKSLEPPAGGMRFRLRAPRAIEPASAPTLRGAFDAFIASQEEVRRFLDAYADLDLAGVRFANPFIRGLRFTLATGLHVIAAHERRHLWQARRVRQAAEELPPSRTI